MRMHAAGFGCMAAWPQCVYFNKRCGRCNHGALFAEGKYTLAFMSYGPEVRHLAADLHRHSVRSAMHPAISLDDLFFWTIVPCSSLALACAYCTEVCTLLIVRLDMC